MRLRRAFFLGFRLRSIVAKWPFCPCYFFCLCFSKTDARVVEAIEAVSGAAELAAFACDVKEALCKRPTAGMAQDFTIINS